MSIYFSKLDLSKINQNRRGSHQSESSASSGGGTQFPVKLHRLIEAAESSGDDDIISWNPDGRSFQVHDTQRFTDEILKDKDRSCGLRQSKFKSLQRQLNLYGFQRINTGIYDGSYKHPWFVQDNVELCKRMTRKKHADDMTALDVILAQSRECSKDNSSPIAGLKDAPMDDRKQSPLDSEQNQMEMPPGVPQFSTFPAARFPAQHHEANVTQTAHSMKGVDVQGFRRLYRNEEELIEDMNELVRMNSEDDSSNGSHIFGGRQFFDTDPK